MKITPLKRALLSVLTSLVLLAAVTACNKDNPAPSAPVTVVIVVTATPIPTATPCQTKILGAAGPLTSSTSVLNGWLMAFPVTCTGPVTVNSLTLGFAAGSSVSVWAAIYTNDSGFSKPGSRLCQTESLAVVSSTLQSIPVPSTVLSSAGVYWIAFQLWPNPHDMYLAGAGRYCAAAYAWNDFPVVIGNSITAYPGNQTVGYLNGCP
jgi:hypothetical protein